MSQVRPGWPAEVPPPSNEEWQIRAAGWLLDQLPGEYRAFEVARRHPVLLAQLALVQVRAELAALTQLLARIRVDMHSLLTPEAIESAVEMLGKRLATLTALERQVTLVAESLERFSGARRV